MSRTEYHRQWRAKNKKKVAAAQKRWRKSAVGKATIQRRNRQYANSGKQSKMYRAWAKRNRKKLNAKNRIWWKSRAGKAAAARRNKNTSLDRLLARGEKLLKSHEV